MLEVIRPGAQMTLQGAPLMGLRHLGFPSSGPADHLSMALANALVGQGPQQTAVEVTLGNAAFRSHASMQIALVGAAAELHLNNISTPQKETINVNKGDILKIGAIARGARIYLAVNGSLDAEAYMRTSSTYMPAGLGGFKGRALRVGDCLVCHPAEPIITQTLPRPFDLTYGSSIALRATEGPDFPQGRADEIFGRSFHVTQRASRMGVALSGKFPELFDATSRASTAMFPGSLQLPSPDEAFLLLADAQTTGGYPHILQVNRSDRHLLGQIRPGGKVQFLRRSPDEAARDLREKHEHFSQFVPDFRF